MPKNRQYCISNIAKSIVITPKEVGNKVFDQVKSMALSAVNWAKKKWDDVKNFANGIVDNLKIFWNQAVNAVKSFFSGDVVGKIKKIIDCVQKLKGLFAGLEKSLKV